jgi:hypothetical protein
MLDMGVCLEQPSVQSVTSQIVLLSVSGPSSKNPRRNASTSDAVELTPRWVQQDRTRANSTGARSVSYEGV